MKKTAAKVVEAVTKEYFQLWRCVKKSAKSLGSFVRLGLRLHTIHGLPYLAADGSASTWRGLQRALLVSGTTVVLPGDLLVRGRHKQEVIYLVLTVALNNYSETERSYPWIMQVYPLQSTVPWTRLEHEVSEKPRRLVRSHNYDDRYEDDDV